MTSFLSSQAFPASGRGGSRGAPEGRNKRSLTARDRRPLDVRLRPFKSSSASQLRVPLAFSRRCSGYSLRCGREIALSLRRWRGCLSVVQRYKNGLYYNAENEMRRFSQTNCSKVGKRNATKKTSRTISLSGETSVCFTR